MVEAAGPSSLLGLFSPKADPNRWATNPNAKLLFQRACRKESRSNVKYFT
jgi:hypothetical protein